MTTMLLQSTGLRDEFVISTDEVKTYKIDWSHRLRCNPAHPNDTIATSTFDPDVVVVVSDSFTPKTTLVTVSAALGIPGMTYPVVNHITTVEGQVDHWTIYFRIREDLP